MKRFPPRALSQPGACRTARKAPWAVLIALGVCWLPAGAAADSGLGFLRQGAGARSAALAGAATALSDPSAASLNPAALAEGRSMVLSHTEWIGGMRHEQAGALWTGAAGGVVALDARLAHAGGLERRTGPTRDPLGEFGLYEWTAGAAWSRPWGERLRTGVGAKVVRQSIDVEAASGLAADLGLLYGAGRWRVGAALRNLGRMNELHREATELPLQARLGAAVVRGPLMASADVGATRGSGASLHLGGEWRPSPRLVLRTGYATSGTRNPAFGAGVSVHPWRFDYAILPFTDGLGQAHRVSLVWWGS